MQNILSISKRWYDPVPGLTRAIILIIAVLIIESLPFLFKGILLSLPQIYLQGLLRLADILILAIWGLWSFKGPDIGKAVKDTMIVTIFFIVAGLLSLACWKNIFGSSMLQLDNKIFRQNALLLIAFFITSCLLSPVAEELFFRGIFYRKMREKLNWWTSIGIVTSIFALIHLYFNGQALVPFLGSLIFCFGYEKTKFILTPILLHISGNMIIYLSPFLGFI